MKTGLNSGDYGYGSFTRGLENQAQHMWRKKDTNKWQTHR